MLSGFQLWKVRYLPTSVTDRTLTPVPTQLPLPTRPKELDSDEEKIMQGAIQYANAAYDNYVQKTPRLTSKMFRKG